MKFNEYVNVSMVCSELLESVEETSLPTMCESLDLMEQELNELFGLGKVAEKLKSLDTKADEKVEDIKKKGKEFASDAKYVAKNLGQEAKEKWADAKEVAQSHKEIAVAAKDKLVSLFSKSQSAFKDIWGAISKENLSDDQKSVLADLAMAQQKMTSGKFLNGDDSVKVLAAILAGKGSVPSSKKYLTKLEELKAIPGIATVRVSARVK